MISAGYAGCAFQNIIDKLKKSAGGWPAVKLAS